MSNSTSDIKNDASFEDRHFLSSPRPIPNVDLATWDVDIMRHGVDMPIMTIRVDNTVLPPRKNKKKTVWKLPDSIDTLPKLGVQDKRRIFDLFREKKKELKKLKSKQKAYQRASTIFVEAMSAGGSSSNGENVKANVKVNTNGSNTRGDDNSGKILTNTAKKDTCPLEDRKEPSAKETKKRLTDVVDNKNNNNAGLYNTQKRDNNKITKELIPDTDSGTRLPPPGFGNLSILEPVLDDEKGKVLEIESPTTTSVPSHPPPPPPGLLPHAKKKYLDSTTTINGKCHQQNSISAQDSSADIPPSRMQQNGHQQQSRQSFLIPPQGRRQNFPPPPSTKGPCFTLPVAPSTLGKFVTETYYLSLRNVLIHELDAYYFNPLKEDINNGNETTVTSNVVYKSVTVGGAHAVCATQQDRLMQLQTFAGAGIEMRIKGVQQQPTTGNGVLILITGVSIRTVATTVASGSDYDGQQQQQQQQQIILPFCHTLILTPVSIMIPSTAPNDTVTAYNTKLGYQILNDNLVILTGDD